MSPTSEARPMRRVQRSLRYLALAVPVLLGATCPQPTQTPGSDPNRAEAGATGQGETARPGNDASEPAPQPVAGGGPAAGDWACYNYQPHLGFGTYWGILALDGTGRYEHRGVGTGRYERTGNSIRFVSGDLAPIYDVTFPAGPDGKSLDLIGKGEMQDIFVRCGHS